ncbi:MAG TPA: hypothetical protein VKY59_14290, partial [Spirillospora sp.]|nr:hypothetical protein [Spirillospora sp.]
GPLLVNLIYGAVFATAAHILPLLGWSLLPAALKGARTLYWYAQGAEQFVNRVTMLALLVQAVLSVVTIERYGAAGVALTLIVTESAALALLWLKRPPPDAGTLRQDD